AEGQIFTVKRHSAAGYVIVRYDIYDAGDMLSTMPNGSDAKEFTFMQYMNVGTGRAS
ncbi:unnamed protein product, partial [marine sediment metagenome]